MRSSTLDFGLYDELLSIHGDTDASSLSTIVGRHDLDRDGSC